MTAISLTIREGQRAMSEGTLSLIAGISACRGDPQSQTFITYNKTTHFSCTDLWIGVAQLDLEPECS